MKVYFGLAYLCYYGLVIYFIIYVFDIRLKRPAQGFELTTS